MEDAQRPAATAVDHVLIVATAPAVQTELREVISRVGLKSVAASGFEAARQAGLKTIFAVAVVDVGAANPSAALELVTALRQQSQQLTEVILLAEQPSFELPVLAMRQGACDVVLKQPDQLAYLGPRALALHHKVQLQVERAQLLSEAARLNEELLFKLTDQARRVGELRAQLSQRGTSPLPPDQEHAHILLVEDDGWLAKAIGGLLPKSFVLTPVGSGGAALDSASERPYDLALVKETLPDLPGRMVVRTLSAQSPETMVLMFTPPTGRKPGRIDRVEGGKVAPLVPEFVNPKQLADRLHELFQAQIARRRERRYLAEFRAENYELLRRFADLRRRIRPGEGEGGGSSGKLSP
jgi:DNA-binding response OmpR family regulator